MLRMVLGFLIFFSFLQSYACDLQIRKTANPINQQTVHQDLCLDDYFAARNLAFHSISANSMQFLMSKSATTMQYDDMILFDLPLQTAKPLGEAGRLAVVKTILTSYFSSLRNEFGACTLSLYDGAAILTIDDFKLTARDIEGQPGTRLMLTKDDVKNPAWEMTCPTESGSYEVAKSGKYFFIFVDVHENVSITTTTTHYSQFLFSLN
jgi:hypothetical protein